MVCQKWGLVLIRMCGGNPLMLRLVATVIKDLDKPAGDWSCVCKKLDQLLQQTPPLPDCDKPLFVYQPSIDRLPHNVVSLLQTLVFFPPNVPVPKAAVATVWSAIYPDSDSVDAMFDIVRRASIIDEHVRLWPLGSGALPQLLGFHFVTEVCYALRRCLEFGACRSLNSCFVP